MLPLELNKLLIIVVVLSMALTPLLNEIGRKASEFIGEKFDSEDVSLLPVLEYEECNEIDLSMSNICLSLK